MKGGGRRKPTHLNLYVLPGSRILVEIFRASHERFLKELVDSATLRALLIERDAHTSPMLEHESNRREPCTVHPTPSSARKHEEERGRGQQVDALVLVEDLADLV